MDHLLAIPHVEITDKTCEDFKRELIICMKKQKKSVTAMDTKSYMKIVKNYFYTVDQFIMQRSYIVNTIMYKVWFHYFWEACQITDEIRIIAIKIFAKNNLTNAIKPDIPFWYAKYLLKTIISLIEDQDKIRFDFVKILLTSCLRTATSLPKQIIVLQSIVEVLETYKKSPDVNIKNIIRQNFQDNIELHAFFCSINVRNVDSCARRVLNMINAERSPPNIFSMLYTKVQLGRKQLQYESDTEELWVDFNLIERNITVQCKLSCLLDGPSFTELDNNLIETITVDFDSITLVREKTWWYKGTEGKLILFDLNAPCRCVYSSARDLMDKIDCLMLFIGSNENLEQFLQFLVEIFLTKFRRSSQSTSKVLVAQNDGAIENSVQCDFSSRMCSSRFRGYSSANDNQSFSLHLPVQSKIVVNVAPHAEEILSAREKQFSNKLSKATSNGQSILAINNNENRSLFLKRPEQTELDNNRLSAKQNEEDDDNIIESSQENIPQLEKIQRKINKIRRQVNLNVDNPLAQFQQYIDLPSTQPEILITDTNPQLPVAPEHNYTNQTPKRNSNYQRTLILKTPGTSPYPVVASYALSDRTEIPQSQISRATTVIDEIDLVSPSGEFQDSLHPSGRLNGNEGDLELYDLLASPSRSPSEILSANWSYTQKSPKSTSLQIPEKSVLADQHSSLKIKSKPTSKQVVTQSQNSEMDFQPRAYPRKTQIPNIGAQMRYQQKTYSNNSQASNVIQAILSGTELVTDKVTQSSSADFQLKILKPVTNNHKSFTNVPETNLSQNSVPSQNSSSDAFLASRVPINIVRKPCKYQKKKIQFKRLNKSLNIFSKESSEKVPPRNLNVTAEAILNSALKNSTEASPKKLDLQPSLPPTTKRTRPFYTIQQNLVKSQNIISPLSKNCPAVVQPLRRLTPTLQSILSQVPQNSAFPTISRSSNQVDPVLPISQMSDQRSVKRLSSHPPESSNNTIIQSSENAVQSCRTLYNPKQSLYTRADFQKSLTHIPSSHTSNNQSQPEIICPVSSSILPKEMIDTTLISTTPVSQSARAPIRLSPTSTDFPRTSKSYIENNDENQLNMLAETATRLQKINSSQNYAQSGDADINLQHGDTNLDLAINNNTLEISEPSLKRRRSDQRNVDAPTADISFVSNETSYDTDELNDTYLKKHSAEIRQTLENGFYKEQIVVKGTSSKSTNNPECFNKTADHIISSSSDSDDSYTNLSIKHKCKKNDHQYTNCNFVHFNRSCSTIGQQISSKNRSVLNNTLELLTQDPSPPSDNFTYSQIQNEARTEYSKIFNTSLRVTDRKQLVENNIKIPINKIQKQYDRGVQKYFSTIKYFDEIFHQVENMDNISERKECIKSIMNNIRSLDSVYDVARRKFGDSE